MESISGTFDVDHVSQVSLQSVRIFSIITYYAPQINQPNSDSYIPPSNFNILGYKYAEPDTSMC